MMMIISSYIKISLTQNLFPTALKHCRIIKAVTVDPQLILLGSHGRYTEVSYLHKNVRLKLQVKQN